jgi:hypothetical protein
VSIRYRCTTCMRDFPVPSEVMDCWAEHVVGRQNFRDLVQAILDGTRTAEGLLRTISMYPADTRLDCAAIRDVARKLMVWVAAVAVEAASKIPKGREDDA